MRQVLLAFAVAAVAAASACSGGKSSSAPPGPGDDGGSGDDGGTTQSFTYSPQGCQYTVSPPDVLGFTDLALDSTTAPVDPTNGVPQRVRVGLGGGTSKGQPGYADPTTTAAFTWETAESDQAAEVKIGTDQTSLTDVHTGYAWTAPKMLSSVLAYMHEVHVCGLKPNTTYFYQVGGGPQGAQVWSATQSFTTMPADPTATVTLGIFGDARDKVTTWTAVHQRMKDAGVLMSLVGGDVVDTGSIEDLYQQWLDAIWKDPSNPGKFLTLGQQYILPIDGNHENDSGISFANWALPGDGPYAETYASFDVGAAHVAMIDDEQIATSLEQGGASTEATAQLGWLDKDLSAAAADRTNHPFIVVISHRGLYSTSEHGGDPDVTAARGALAPIFDKYAVDLVINGHDHEYEKSYPLKAGNPPGGAPVVGSGTTYVICAGAGADPYAVGKSQAAFSAKQICLTGAPNCTQPYIGTYGLLAIQPHTMTLTAYGMQPSGTKVADDAVIDTVPFTH
jgi:hypothetical protein